MAIAPCGPRRPRRTSEPPSTPQDSRAQIPSRQSSILWTEAAKIVPKNGVGNYRSGASIQLCELTLKHMRRLRDGRNTVKRHIYYTFAALLLNNGAYFALNSYTCHHATARDRHNHFARRGLPAGFRQNPRLSAGPRGGGRNPSVETKRRLTS